MCGRFIQIFEPEKIRVHFPDLEMDAQALGGMAPRYNIAPTQDILTVLNTPAPKLTLVHWGLIPFWARDRSMGARMINARAETLPDKPSFKTPFQKRRCIIFSEGFYEWKGAGRDKAPFFIRLKSRQPFGMAGLWDSWRDTQSGKDIISGTIITTGANQVVARIHNRMPVILNPDHYRLWLSADIPGDDTLKGLLRPYDHEAMEAYGISRFVNNPKNDSPECIRPVQ